MSHLTAKDCKVVIKCIFTEVKESMIGEVKGGRMTMLHQVENISKYIEIIKENLNSRVEKFND